MNVNGDKDDPAPVLLEHWRQIEPAQPGPAEHVDLEEPQPVLVGDLGERLGLEDAEVVHQDVHRRHFAGQQVHAFLRAEVGRHTPHLGVVPLRLNAPEGLLDPSLGAAVHHDRRPLLG
jgi:hypothetical protein